MFASVQAAQLLKQRNTAYCLTKTATYLVAVFCWLQGTSHFKVHVYYICMFLLPLFHHYFLWHYTGAFREILHVAKNLLWFVIHFFSLPQLIKSLFAPWKRITEERGEGLSLENLAGYIIINLISRLIGGLLRSVIILIGTVSLVVLLLSVVLIFIFWVTTPIVILGCIYYGLYFIVSLWQPCEPLVMI